MKNLIMLLFLVTIFSLNANAEAGHDGGNGGRGYICEIDGKIEKAVMYDLATAAHYDFKKYDSVQQGLDDVVSIMNKAKPEFTESFRGLLEYIHNLAKKQDQIFVSFGQFEEARPKFDIEKPRMHIFLCDNGDIPKFVSIASYDDVGRNLKINGKYYNKLDNTHKVALILHEALYKLRRIESKEQFADTSSELTALLLSTEPLQSKIDEIQRFLK